MLDWEGKMQPKKDHQHRIVLDNVEDDINMVASLQITPLEQESINAHLVEDDKHYDGMRIDRIPSTTPGAEPPRDAKDSGSARSHSTHLETSSSDQP